MRCSMTPPQCHGRCDQPPATFPPTGICHATAPAQLSLGVRRCYPSPVNEADTTEKHADAILGPSASGIPPRRCVLWLLLGFPSVFVAHSLLVFALYGSGFLPSALVVFLLPSVLAFFGYSSTLKRSCIAALEQPASRRVRTGISFVASCVSLYVGVFFAFNTFGT